MPALTRSQTRSEQPSDRVTSPRVNSPRGRVDARQDNAVVIEDAEAGSPSTSSSIANGRQPTTSFARCNHPRCLTCKNLILSKDFTSTVTNKKYEIINHSTETISCHSQNVIYLLSCTECHIQYVGETTLPLHKRMNIHRKAKTGCENIIKHFKDSCPQAKFTVQIIEKFIGSGYVRGKVCPVKKEERLKREDHWMKSLRTIHPYGLNDKVRDGDNDIPIGKLFPPIPRFASRSEHPRSRQNNILNINSVDEFFSFVTNILNSDIKNAYNQIRIKLNTLKKKTLKAIVAKILQMNDFGPKYINYYHFIVDIIDTKLYHKRKLTTKKSPPKHVCVVKFDNKALEAINLSKILHFPDVISALPSDLQSEDHIPVVTYKLGGTIRNKILNYKDTVESIYVDDEVSFTRDTTPCECESSTFCDPHHKHIITGDLRLIENTKLRKLLTKGPNYREPRSINFSKALKEISIGIDELIESLSSKTDDADQLKIWRDLVILKVKSKITELKKSIIPGVSKPVLSDEGVMNYLRSLHKKYVIVTIDKAANNFAFICKQFYVSKLLDEVGQLGRENLTYSKVDTPIQTLILESIKQCNKYGLDVVEKQKCLPIMYWIPKMHKAPIGSRFIVASKDCCNKPLTKVVSRVFKMIFKHVESFHKRSLFYTNYNKFWVVENSFPIIEKLNIINTRKKAKNISTFDFSTLYTTLPHNLLIQVLTEIINFVFKGNTKTKIGFSEFSTYWTSKGKDKRFFTKSSLADAINFLIKNCFFTIGNMIFKQDIGIPMGIDPAPFWANLFLYSYESKYIQSLVSEGSPLVYKFSGTRRFIDDLCALNDGEEFAKHCKEIYPAELDLKVEHQGSHASFLDLDITVVDGTFVYKMYDKRDQFPFFIVRMPHRSSNIPSYIFYGATFSELLRIARCSLLFEDFLERTSCLFKRMHSQGGEHQYLSKQISKAMQRYPDVFVKYGKSFEEINDLIIPIN